MLPIAANPLQPLIDVNEWILSQFHDGLGFGWGLSIIGLTVVVRLVILPLTYKQVRGMQQMQRLAPEMKKIQERFKDDKQRQQQELMKFYSDHNFNPLSSCLPLLLQLPFFLSLYYLQTQDEFKTEVRETGKEFLFIPDLTENATGGVLVALIVIYVATQLGSSLVTMINIQDKNQRRIMLALPFFFTIIIVNFPTGLLVYWITTNVWTIGQQLAVKKFLPPPEPISEDEAKAKRAGGDGKPGKRRQGMIARAAERAQEQAGERKGAERPTDGKGPKPKAKASSGAGKASGGDGKKASGGDGNGGPRKPPPPSPRKKKKRSGRRR